MTPTIALCRNCEQPFSRARRDKVTCSNACRQRRYRRRGERDQDAKLREAIGRLYPYRTLSRNSREKEKTK